MQELIRKAGKETTETNIQIRMSEGLSRREAVKEVLEFRLQFTTKKNKRKRKSI